jgi:hypothetical protein
VSGKIAGIALENLNISGMMRRFWVKFDD